MGKLFWPRPVKAKKIHRASCRFHPITEHTVKKTSVGGFCSPTQSTKFVFGHWVKLKPLLYSLHPTFIKDVGGDHRPTLHLYKWAMHSCVNGKPLIKKNHSTYQIKVFGNGGSRVHFYKKRVPLMEPSNWSRVYNSPTKKVILAHFTRNNCLLVFI